MPSKPKSTRLPMTANADCARRRRKPSTIWSALAAKLHKQTTKKDTTK